MNSQPDTHSQLVLFVASKVLRHAHDLTCAAHREHLCFAAWIDMLCEGAINTPPEQVARADYQEASAAREQTHAILSQTITSATTFLLVELPRAIPSLVGPAHSSSPDAAPSVLLYLPYLEQEMEALDAATHRRHSAFTAWLQELADGMDRPPEIAARATYQEAAAARDTALHSLRQAILALTLFIQRNPQLGTA